MEDSLLEILNSHHPVGSGDDQYIIAVDATEALASWCRVVHRWKIIHVNSKSPKDVPIAAFKISLGGFGGKPQRVLRSRKQDSVLSNMQSLGRKEWGTGPESSKYSAVCNLQVAIRYLAWEPDGVKMTNCCWKVHMPCLKSCSNSYCAAASFRGS